ncbi:MAG: hypothetical protein R2939_14980 [Kofleriaceae bacterium]
MVAHARTAFAVTVAAVLATAAAARADDAIDDGVTAVDKGPFGVGLILGEPTGISARLYLHDDQAVQAAVGSAFVGGGLQVHADYVWHPWVLERRPSFALVAYLGPGVRTILYDAGRGASDFVALGLRAVGGLVFDFREVPLDAFIEVAGVGEYAFADGEGWGASLNAGAGVRYYF